MRVLSLVIFAIVVLVILGCADEKVYRSNINAREEVFKKAQALYPQPIPLEFPVRKALVDYTNRISEKHLFYVYVFGDNGNIIGYYVAQTAPQNACNFLSTTENYIGNGVILQAPSLDGVYYGGTGASGACDEWFFFDSATNALIKIRGFKFFTTDQPLKVAADPILVQVAK